MSATMTHIGYLIFNPKLLAGDLPRVDDFDMLWRALVAVEYQNLAPDGETERIRIWIHNEINAVALNTILSAPLHCKGVSVEDFFPAHIDVHLTPHAWGELIARGLRAARYMEVSHE